jgi:ceramide glucosyltransferase
LIAFLSVVSLSLSAGLWICLAATLRHFRGAPTEPCALPMTLIKPIKGLDDDMEEGFRSIVAADPLKTLQVLIALETDGDPAYPVTRAFADAHPDRDISVVLTGPSGPRMGKIHNMIEALPHAKHRIVLFSDADTRITRSLLADTARAFAEGADAVYAMPYHAFVPGLGGWLFVVAFNHSFCVPVALTARAGKLRSFAGAWMGYTKEALARIGGLKKFENAIAEDLSLGLAASAAGLGQVLLREPVRVSETGSSPGEAFAHISKWASIIFWSWPAPVLAAPLLSPSLQAFAALALASAVGRPKALPLVAVAFAVGSRVSVGIIQDRLLGAGRAPLWRYATLALADVGALVFLPLALRRTVVWRGKTYRLSLGGRAQVVG